MLPGAPRRSGCRLYRLARLYVFRFTRGTKKYPKKEHIFSHHLVYFLFGLLDTWLYHISHFFFVFPRRLLSPTPLPPRLRLTAASLKETVIDGAKRALPDSLRGAVRSPAWISLTKSVLLAWISFSQCPTSHFINNSGRSILSIIRTPALQRHAPHSQKCIAVGYWRSHCKFPCRPGSHFQPTPWVGWEGPVSLAPSPNALPAWDCQNVEAANYGPPGSHLAVGARAVWVGRSACPPEIWQEHGPLVLWSACGSLQPPHPPIFRLNQLLQNGARSWISIHRCVWAPRTKVKQRQ